MFHIIAQVYRFIMCYLLQHRDFKVTRVEMEYTHDGDDIRGFIRPRVTCANGIRRRVTVPAPEKWDSTCEMSPFWTNESRYWSTYKYKYWVDVTDADKDEVMDTPPYVSDQLFVLSYEVDGKDYRCASRTMDTVWPPKKTRPFILLITKAVLLDEDDNPVKDVTNTIKKYAGYYGDFHGFDDITIQDIIMYDDYVKMKVTNILGQSKVVDRYSSVLRLL